MKAKILFSLLLISFLGISQSFEGVVTYKIETIKTSNVYMSEEQWKDRLNMYYSEKGFAIKKCFYKENKYKIETEHFDTKKIQVFNPDEELIYNWIDQSDTVTTIKSNQNKNELLEISEVNKTTTVLGIVCKGLLIKTRQGYSTIWYNSNYLKINSNLFNKHIYGSWSQILKRTGSLPLKIESTGEIGMVVQTLLNFQPSVISQREFNIPKFSEEIESEENNF